MNRSGLGAGAYAVLASVALATGLMLLSFSGGIFSLTGQALQDDGSGGLDPGLDGVDPPETGLNTSEYIDEETARQAADSDIVRGLARGLFEFLSGQDLSPPDDLGINGSVNVSDVNGTIPDGEVGGTNVTGDPGDGANITDGNASDGGTGETDASDGGGEDGSNVTDGGDDDTDTTDGQQDTNATDGSEEPRDNGTDDGSQTDPGGQNASMPDDNASSSGGFLSDMVERFADVLGGSDEGSDDGETSGQQDRSDRQQDDGDAGVGRGLPSLGDLRGLMVPLAVLGLAIGGLLAYRSDKGWREIVRMLVRRARSFITSLPDLVRRVLVRMVAGVISVTRSVWRAAGRLVSAPVKTLQEAWSAVLELLDRIRVWLRTIRQRSVRENVDVLLHSGGNDLEGLDRLWIRLKEAVGAGAGSMTPVEVGRAAIEQGFPEETIEEIVAALRQRKYSSRVLEGVDVDRWERALWGDDGV